MIMEYMDSVEPKLNVAFSFSGFVREGRLLVPSIIEESLEASVVLPAPVGPATPTRMSFSEAASQEEAERSCLRAVTAMYSDSDSETEALNDLISL